MSIVDIDAFHRATAWKREYRAPPEEEARAIRSLITAWLWDALGPEPLTERAREWLEARGLRPELAHALGCRDWRPVLTRLKETLEPLSPPERVASGFFFEGGSLWWPLGGDHGCRSEVCRPKLAGTDELHPRAAGLCVPVWDGALPHPPGWLWQLYEPISTSAADNCMRNLTREQPTLLGLQTSSSGLPAAGAHPRLVVVEGPLEWLSAVQAVEGRAAVMGTLRSSSFWLDAWTPFLEDAERAAVLLPERQGYAGKAFEALERSAALHLGPGWTRAHLTRHTFPEEDGCQALLRRGELTGLIDELLAT